LKLILSVALFLRALSSSPVAFRMSFFFSEGGRLPNLPLCPDV